MSTGAFPGNCEMCGIYRWCRDQDHIIPRWKGGTDDPSNIQYVCQNCHRDKTREDMTGLKQSPEWIEKRAAANRGKKRSIESRARMSEAQHRPEVKAKVVAGLTGLKRSTETRANMSEAQRRRAKPSEETRAKMSKAQKAHWALTPQERIERAQRALAAAVLELSQCE